MNPASPTSAITPAHDPWAIRTVEIRGIVREIQNVRTLSLAFPDRDLEAGYSFAPGQFNMLYLPGAGEAAISLSGDPTDCRTLEHTIRAAGNVTRGLCDLPVGSTLGLRGPFGRGWPLAECEGKDVLLVTGGIGLPPLRPAIYHLLQHREKFGRLHLLYGARSPDSLLFRSQFPGWADAGLEIQETVDRSAPGWPGSVGVVTVLLDRLESLNPGNSILFCCGPEVMMRYVARCAIERGLKSSQIWISTERHMNCAIGLCGHCQLAGSFVCKDGPVFRYDEISRYLNVQGM